jgi:hypothetical protein
MNLIINNIYILIYFLKKAPPSSAPSSVAMYPESGEAFAPGISGIRSPPVSTGSKLLLIHQIRIIKPIILEQNQNT